MTQRDYAASGSLQEAVGDDMDLPPKFFADKIYTVYLDDPQRMGGRRQRFASGYLVTDKKGKAVKAKLMARNESRKPAPTDDDLAQLAAHSLWPRLPYQHQSLPRVKAAVVQFPFTNGFVSSLILSIKVIPALRRYAQQHSAKGSPITVVSTCSIPDEMCTHYAPLSQGKKFLLGRPDMETYLKELGPEPFLSLDWKGVQRMCQMIFPPLKYVWG
jgi:hypothetical protein